jgi:hypothetical protein
VFVIIKHIQKEKNYMLTLGLKPMEFVSEEYCYHALMRSATSGCGKQLPFRNIHMFEAELASHTPRKTSELKTTRIMTATIRRVTA